MNCIDRPREIADIIARLEHCLIRLDALGISRAAIRVDHAIEDLRNCSGSATDAQPKQERPA